MSQLIFADPGTLTRAAVMDLEHEQVPQDQRAAGAPTTATAALGTLNGLELGVWEMTPGAMTDVEADEVFIVLHGAATVEIAAFNGRPARTLTPGPGDIVQLAEGMETLWTVTETFRKVYLA